MPVHVVQLNSLPAVAAKLKELENSFERGLGNVVVPKPASEMINGDDRINIQNLGIDWKLFLVCERLCRRS
jgi:hypothetical protein